MRMRSCNMLAALLCAVLIACGSGGAPPPRTSGEAGTPVAPAPAQLVPEASFHRAGGVTLGAPRAVSVDFSGTAFIADASPGRLLAYYAKQDHVVEFKQPPVPAFYPTDVSVRGFFVYAINDRDRTLLRFDNMGEFRDVLLDFENLDERRRVTPHGLAVQETGRLAVTDVENHQVLVINNYLRVEVAFGQYGSFPGQLDTPRGVSFMKGSQLLVTDTGNQRLQIFTDGGSFVRQIPPADVPSPMLQPLRSVAGPDGRIYVADPRAGRVFVFSPGGMPAGSFVPSGMQRFEPTDVELTRDGRLLVTDMATQSLFVFKGM